MEINSLIILKQSLKWCSLKTWLVITRFELSFATLWYALCYSMSIKQIIIMRIVRERERAQVGSWCAGGTQAKEIDYNRGRKCPSFFGKRVWSIVFSLWIIISFQLRLTCWNESSTSSKAGTSHSRMVIFQKGAQWDCSWLKSFSIKEGKKKNEGKK